MSELAIVCVGLGVLTIAIRGPLIFAPQRTIEVYRRVFRNEAGTRAIGALVVVLGAALVLAGRGAEPSWTGLLLILAVLMVGGGVVVLLWPSLFRRLAETMLDMFSDSAVLRVFGVLAVGIGVGLIYLGLRVC